MTIDPAIEPPRFARWVPNVSGGLVVDLILTGFRHYRVAAG